METLLVVLIVVQFIIGIIKDQQRLNHIKELEFKLMTGDPGGKETKNDFEMPMLHDITDVNPETAAQAIKNVFKKKDR